MQVCGHNEQQADARLLSWSFPDSRPGSPEPTVEHSQRCIPLNCIAPPLLTPDHIPWLVMTHSTADVGLDFTSASALLYQP